MRILIAEDDAVSRRMLQGLLQKWNYDVQVAGNGAEAWQVLQGDNPPRLAILDWMMPEMDGIQVCQKVRQLMAEPYTYIILLTGRDHKEDVIKGIESGADDYLSKPFDHDELKARIRSGTRILALQESLVAARDVLQFQATHDALSGLWNRGAILEALQREMARANRQKTPVALMMADLDHFKHVNDTFGHQVGDEVLREAACRMRQSVRLYDLIGRYGGEEFLLIMPGCDSHDALKQAERLCAEIASTPFETSSGPIAGTLSIGVAGGRNPTDINPTSLLRAADEALYRAKERGRNRVVSAEEDRKPSSPPTESAFLE